MEAAALSIGRWYNGAPLWRNEYDAILGGVFNKRDLYGPKYL